jgi:hypothetical protein
MRWFVEPSGRGATPQNETLDHRTQRLRDFGREPPPERHVAPRKWCALSFVESDYWIPLPVVCQNSVDRPSSPPAVIIEYPTQSSATLNRRIDVDYFATIVDQSIVEPLMVPLDVVMRRVFLHGVA